MLGYDTCRIVKMMKGRAHRVGHEIQSARLRSSEPFSMS